MADMAESGRLDHRSTGGEPPRTPAEAPQDVLNEDRQGLTQGNSSGSGASSAAEATQEGGERDPEGEGGGRKPVGERDRDYDPDGDRLGG